MGLGPPDPVGLLNPWLLCEVASRGDISYPDAVDWDLRDREMENPRLGMALGHGWWLSQHWDSKVGCLEDKGRSKKDPQCPVQGTK